MFENSKVAVIYVLKSWDYIKGLQKLSIFPIEISLFNPVFECEDIIDGSIVKAIDDEDLQKYITTAWPRDQRGCRG